MYRGVKSSTIKSLDDYEIGSTGFWPQFSSTSRDKQVSQGFADAGKIEGKEVRVLFKIFLTNNNYPNTHISCDGELDENGMEVNKFTFFP